MFDWPLASTFLGLIAAVIVALIKFVPQRTVVENFKGEPCASKEDVRAMQQALHEHHKYTEQRNHDILNALDRVQGTILIEIKEHAGSHSMSLNTISANQVRIIERMPRRRDYDDTDSN